MGTRHFFLGTNLQPQLYLCGEHTLQVSGSNAATGVMLLPTCVHRYFRAHCDTPPYFPKTDLAIIPFTHQGTSVSSKEQQTISRLTYSFNFKTVPFSEDFSDS